MDGRITFLLMVVAVLGASGRRSQMSPRMERRDPETLACGSTTRPEIMKEMTGLFGSPNYPANYDNLDWCEWSLFYEAEGHDGRVLLSFPYFDTEFDFDFVYVYDGANGTGPLLAQYSGKQSVATLTSTMPGMLIRFLTDQLITDIGFEAAWTSDPACFDNEHSYLRGTGSFTSPFHPEKFSGDLYCDWIVGTPGKTVEVTFESFHVGTVKEGSHCPDAHLYVSDSVGNDEYICGQKTTPFKYSFQGEIHFHFVAPLGYEALDGEGFLANFAELP